MNINGLLIASNKHQFLKSFTAYVEIFEWLNFRKYGKLKISKKYFQISFHQNA